MRNINDVHTYQDSYGNTKMLTTFDHSPKDEFYQKPDMENVNSLLKAYERNQLEYILSVPQIVLKDVLYHFPELISYDDETLHFVWNIEKVTDLLKDYDWAYNFVRLLKITNEKHATDTGTAGTAE